MTEPSPTSAAEQSADATEQSTGSSGEQAVTDGRYLYCFVDTESADSNDLSVLGVGESSVYVIETESVGAAVHDCEAVYDTESPEQVTQWVLRHQHVVDAAGEVFGTPLPMRFNTIIEGGDASISQWVHENHDTIREALTSFAGTWEYRIRLHWDSSAFEAEIADQDDQLQDLQRRRKQAGSGTSFLLEKQYDKRLRELKQQRRSDLTATLRESISPVVTEMIEQDPSSPLTDDTTAIDGEPVARVAVLADEADETELGNRLDGPAEQEGVSIKFTGPWPPYTFAPDLG
ncbi:Gas vesicle synthesis protein GvpL/GvpF [Halogeometricum borinquense DSM 11551]|uniref:Gas vesicle synthesis protein GvpL/GvpF n=1 Tax=Halogeometricum borinquense (strain ATCC 700274 / DSM 11551 / JCM 10706 / KCTC 4070 / PR3) TaxID=469382 RepID=E4NUR1_HALBP|nr:GvpL/GvpF family gas vesicle protein [Halogeometricum borinquense]ADQ68781.1 Gas vesicle synthesis protein GvpL/GvpF [Halogeometricum borinquense DSM 11551]ELY25656.1 Gas vesicle synthesis protein GvpL/GvpF [Halogeometricum borinquense DSM 11551]